ncbi:hypothetical protein [Burkholderia sp. Ac-20365]|uniref:hypothetical protein n=1 Tax=Burkholderia sp. Ac-20365 TaxID=2703897 RepID=UPI00197C38B1|nr:hypothetical protein [Burkholderia sp. Ac-20365]MBN3760872.1 hypothetical protein [Burkholderia sp. Ac-20365]
MTDPIHTTASSRRGNSRPGIASTYFGAMNHCDVTDRRVFTEEEIAALLETGIESAQLAALPQGRQPKFASDIEVRMEVDYQGMASDLTQADIDGIRGEAERLAPMFATDWGWIRIFEFEFDEKVRDCLKFEIFLKAAEKDEDGLLDEIFSDELCQRLTDLEVERFGLGDIEGSFGECASLTFFADDGADLDRHAIAAFLGNLLTSGRLRRAVRAAIKIAGLE